LIDPDRIASPRAGFVGKGRVIRPDEGQRADVLAVAAGVAVLEKP
jgi:hypothetical protein